MRRQSAALRPQRTTVLLVGEGYAEEAFLRHLRALYALRGGGVAVSVANARGKGAAHVVDYAIRKLREGDYDHRVALLDADVDWTDAVQKRAREARIEVIACEPCLEALLLRVHDIPLREGLASRQLKSLFEKEFSLPADDERIYERHFGRERLEQARERLEQLDRLLHAVTGAA